MKDKPENKNQSETTDKKDVSEKKHYHSPRFQVYGSLNSLTKQQGKGGTLADNNPNRPNSRA